MKTIKFIFLLFASTALFMGCKNSSNIGHQKQLNVSGETDKSNNTPSKVMKKKTVPENLDEAIAYFESEWNEKEKDSFKKEKEDDAVTMCHFSVGLWIRNNWIHGGRGPKLSKYFNDLGIFHPDDMSSIILTSLHRRLNNKDIDLEGQIEKYKKYWKDNK